VTIILHSIQFRQMIAVKNLLKGYLSRGKSQFIKKAKKTLPNTTLWNILANICQLFTIRELLRRYKTNKTKAHQIWSKLVELPGKAAVQGCRGKAAGPAGIMLSTCCRPTAGKMLTTCCRPVIKLAAICWRPTAGEA
jgi:hypothetical protein